MEDDRYLQQGLVAGTDEAGRGPLAGDVYAAAVILDWKRPILGLDDSKKLSDKRRNQLFGEICECALAFSIARATVAEIDQINILQASLLAMKRAVTALNPAPDFVLVDGNRLPKWNFRSEALVGGDSRISAIAAASILAKVSRDQAMIELDKQYPDYGFAQHKGYPTAMHLAVLEKIGPCAIHRTSFTPVKQASLF